MAFLMIAWGFLKSGLGSAFAFLSRLSLMQLALIAVTAIGIGFHIADQRHIRRVEAHDAATSRALGKERIAHAADIARWKAASEAATALNKATLARVAAEQSAINKESTDAYQVQLADLRARFGGMRDRKAPINQRPANGDRASPVPVAAPGVAGEAVPRDQPDLQYTAETELQLNALISWVQKQSAVDPNAR